MKSQKCPTLKWGANWDASSKSMFIQLLSTSLVGCLSWWIVGCMSIMLSFMQILWVLILRVAYWPRCVVHINGLSQWWKRDHWKGQFCLWFYWTSTSVWTWWCDHLQWQTSSWNNQIFALLKWWTLWPCVFCLFLVLGADLLPQALAKRCGMQPLNISTWNKKWVLWLTQSFTVPTGCKYVIIFSSQSRIWFVIHQK